MTYQLLATDMDGTVLTREQIISPRTSEALHQALRDGYEVFFATGRCLDEIRNYVADFPEMHYLLTISGAAVFDLRTGKAICDRPIPPEVFDAAMETKAGCDVMPAYYIGESVVIERKYFDRMPHFKCECFEKLLQKVAVWVDDIDSVLRERKHEIYKVNFFCADDAEYRAIGEALGKLPVSIASAIVNNYEISAEGVNKGMGLRALCDYIGVPVECAIACGDEGNDIEMLRTAGLGAAMGNAIPAAKAAANIVVADCDHDGVAEAAAYLGKEIGA